MHAYVIQSYGAINDVVRLVDVPAPTPKANEVVIDIKASALNPIDLRVITGSLKRVNPYPMPHRIGFDGSGVISSRGENVRNFAVGDQVFVRASRSDTGTFAEQIAVEASIVALKPKTVDFQGAAALPLVALTTIQGLTDRAHAKAGQRILIQAGSGGVGSFAIQFAKSLGLHVTTTTSSGNINLVSGLGADEVIPYDRQDYRSNGRVYDIVLDTLGGEATLASFEVCKPGGSVVSIAGPPDKQMPDQVGARPIGRLMMNLMSRKVYAASRKYGVAYFRFLTESSGRQLAEIAALVDEGRVHPVIDQAFSFDKLPEALSYLATGRATGKVLLLGL